MYNTTNQLLLPFDDKPVVGLAVQTNSSSIIIDLDIPLLSMIADTNNNNNNGTHIVDDNNNQLPVQHILPQLLLSISGQQIATLIVPYSLIFLLAIVGNLLVIVTLAANRRMRSVTNRLLLNLAVSDLLLAVFCMPFTLMAVLFKQFIFGQLMCSLIPYLQAVLVMVSVWTLVVVSVERYYAICQPLRSRGYRQTLSYAYRIIGLVWFGSLVLMSPIAVVSRLQPIENIGIYECRESWPTPHLLTAFTLFLDVLVFIIPLMIMSITYTSIAITLRYNLRSDRCRRRRRCRRHGQCLSSETDPRVVSLTTTNTCIANPDTTTRASYVDHNNREPPQQQPDPQQPPAPVSTVGLALRSNTCPLVAEARQKRIVLILFLVVIEFFLCWTPIYTVNTIGIWYGREWTDQTMVGTNWLSFFQLLTFFSCCTNPFTYGFMNSKFRQCFRQLFKCF
ncbi:cholecystokinin receptor type A-like [Oppia nitens]|uniref:cholecystokinin receptor type A-like n=1 Tax=Oppia nitens TaxID=1686743 RepID=UPI0023DAE99B|nr:cholecystokinin receptor type A-like [Oppia nitens]